MLLKLAVLAFIYLCLGLRYAMIGWRAMPAGDRSKVAWDTWAVAIMGLMIFWGPIVGSRAIHDIWHGGA